MACLRIYTDDLRIAQAILRRDERTVRQYFYLHCYPLFKAVYDNYYTDCESCVEFIHEIFVLVLTPSRITGRCQLQNYRGESTLASWLKSVSLFYCYRKYVRRKSVRVVRPSDDVEEKGNTTDRKIDSAGSCELDTAVLNREDAERIIAMMPNKRYARLIRLRYLDQCTNEETACALGITMENYYNKHKLAKRQYEQVCGKEASNG